jgi:hypothetical protein
MHSLHTPLPINPNPFLPPHHQEKSAHSTVALHMSATLHADRHHLLLFHWIKTLKKALGFQAQSTYQKKSHSNGLSFFFVTNSSAIYL